jgi:hypothetical protein
MKLTKPLNFGGRLFMPGENAKGALPLDVIEQLKLNGVIVDENGSNEENEKTPETPPQASSEEPTLEEFIDLKAQEQKMILEQLGIEAATNAEKRVEQYREWLAGRKEDLDAEH